MGEIAERAYGLPTFYGVFQGHKTECANIWRKWSDETLEQYENHIIRHIVPNLPDHNLRSIDEYTLEDFQAVLQRLEQNGLAERTREKMLHIMKTVVAVASEHYSYVDNCFNTPKAKKDVNYSAKVQKPPELCVPPRSLTPEQELRVDSYIKENKSDPLVLGLWLMFACGLRNSEVCGLNFSYIVESRDEPGEYELRIPQSGKPSQRAPQIGGKTYNTARSIPLEKKMALELLDLRDERLKKAGVDQDLPIIHDGNQLTQRCMGRDLTKAARKLFLSIGMTREVINEIEKDIHREAQEFKELLDDEEFRLIEKDPTAYILRRNFATHLYLLGFTAEENAYLMGHVIEDPSIQRSDYLDPKMFARLRHKLKRRPIINSLNNGELVKIHTGKNTFQAASLARMYIPAGSRRVHIMASGKEPGTPLLIRIRTKDPQTDIKVEYGEAKAKMSVISEQVSIDKLYRDAYYNAMN